MMLRFLLLSGTLLALSGPALAQEPGRSPDRIATLDIEELARIKVTSVARRPELYSEAAAAVRP